jgi:hypothetical protein
MTACADVQSLKTFGKARFDAPFAREGFSLMLGRD